MTLEVQARVDLGRFVLDAGFVCEPGETIAFVGPNGSGKTTALHALAGLRRLSSGAISLDGVPLDAPETGTWVPPERRSIGLAFQDNLLFPHLDVLANVAYGARRAGRSKQRSSADAQGWLERFGVGGLAHERVQSLSGGQAQRVALARALARRPTILLLDEPLSALDSTTRLEVRCELHRYLQGFDGYTFIVAHDIVDVMVLADRVVVFDGGKVAQTVTPSELACRPRTAHAAALVGTNLLRGVRTGSALHLGPGVRIDLPQGGTDGPIDAVIRPSAIAVSRPEGTPAPNAWDATLAGLEASGDRILLRTTDPIAVTAVVGIDAISHLQLTPGSLLRLSVDPGCVAVFDDPSPFVLPRPDGRED